MPVYRFSLGEIPKHDIPEERIEEPWLKNHRTETESTGECRRDGSLRQRSEREVGLNLETVEQPPSPFQESCHGCYATHSDAGPCTGADRGVSRESPGGDVTAGAERLVPRRRRGQHRRRALSESLLAGPRRHRGLPDRPPDPPLRVQRILEHCCRDPSPPALLLV